MPGSQEQGKLYKELYKAIEGQGDVADILQGVSKEDLRAVLAPSNIIIKIGRAELTPTLLSYAIRCNAHKAIKAILNAAKEKVILNEVLIPSFIGNRTNEKELFLPIVGKLSKFITYPFVFPITNVGITTANIRIKSQDAKELIVTPLGFAIEFSKESIKAILGAAREQSILKEVLTANITVKSNDGRERTVTPLGLATDQHKVEAILNAAEGLGILEEVFVVIEKDDRENIKTILQKAGNHNMLDKIHKIEKSMSENGAVKENPPSSENEKQPPENGAKTEQVTNKPIVIGSVCGVIAALAVIGGCFAAGAALPVLAIAGIAVAAALVVGLIAGGITYTVSKPNSKMEEANAQKSNENDNLPTWEVVNL